MSDRFALLHEPSAKMIATVRRADDWWTKGWGVIGWPSLAQGEGLWLPGVNAVHTVFVRFLLDLIFLDTDFRMVRIVYNVRPACPLIWSQGAAHTVEVGGGTFAQAGISFVPGEAWSLKTL